MIKCNKQIKDAVLVMEEKCVFSAADEGRWAGFLGARGGVPRTPMGALYTGV